jgi:MarR family transcriptional regulator, organic hydroperoxide resistance regulator
MYCIKQRSDAAEFRAALTEAYQRFNALQRGEKRCFGVTMSQCMTLELLHQGDHLMGRDLAERLGLDTTTVTRVVDVLVRDGLVRRVRDEKGDRRRIFVSLTARGRGLAEKLEGCADAYCQRILARIPASKREDVMSALRLLVRAIDELPAACG